MNSKGQDRHWIMFGLVSALTVSNEAFAGEIVGPIWVEDTPVLGVLVFISDDVLEDDDHNLGSFVSPNKFWALSFLDITETEFGLDTVMVSGGLQHLFDGPMLTFDFSFDATTPGITKGVILGKDAQEHGMGFIDDLLIQVQADVLGDEITGYGIGIGVSHVPGPSALALLAIAMLVPTRSRRRRL